MNSALIVAAGRGTRMGPGVDKLFLSLAGRPVIAHTWNRFEESPEIDEIVLVARAESRPALAELATRYAFRKPYRLIAGGLERQDSVWNGLLALHPASELVAVHDGARPCTPPGLIRAVLVAARTAGAAVAASRVTDTLKESNGGTQVLRTVDRSRLFSVQTLQAFRVEVLRRALERVRTLGQTLTDDTAACEAIGQPVILVESPGPNPKVTAPADLPYIEWLLRPMTGAKV